MRGIITYTRHTTSVAHRYTDLVRQLAMPRKPVLRRRQAPKRQAAVLFFLTKFFFRVALSVARLVPLSS